MDKRASSINDQAWPGRGVVMIVRCASARRRVYKIMCGTRKRPLPVSWDALVRERKRARRSVHVLMFMVHVVTWALYRPC